MKEVIDAAFKEKGLKVYPILQDAVSTASFAEDKSSKKSRGTSSAGSWNVWSSELNVNLKPKRTKSTVLGDDSSQGGSRVDKNQYKPDVNEPMYIEGIHDLLECKPEAFKYNERFPSSRGECHTRKSHGQKHCSQ